jgi:hypothetical protein
VIRLRGPWQYRVIPSAIGDAEVSASGGDEGLFTAPDGLAELVPHGFRGRIRLQRGFQRPSGLTHASTLWLQVVTGRHGQIWLNETCLGSMTAGENRLVLPRPLAVRNQLRIELVIDVDSPIDQPICDVQLEIVETDGSQARDESTT